MIRKTLIALLWLVAYATLLPAQTPRRYSASDIRLMLEQLNVLGSVLYVAAHPDDENTRLISYFANERHLYTGYFSFTRGDGGQNLIGPEIREQLGVIRTQELLSARRIDGGQQFFSRTVDFGYSKTADETFDIWDREKALHDLVWVIRKFKPDVIITRFNTNPGETHGHHTASAILAEEAFDKAADPEAFKKQLQHVEPWQPTSLYWNTYWWRKSEMQKDTSELLKIDVGAYNELIGKSYTEIAAQSRSQHKSQGFGATGSRGRNYEYLQHVKGYDAQKNVFETIDTGWSRVSNSGDISALVDEVIADYDPAKPEGVLPELLKLREAVKGIDDDFWKSRKLQEIDELIYACTGLYLEAVADDYAAIPGDSVEINIEATNRSSADIKLKQLQINRVNRSEQVEAALPNNVPFESKLTIKLPSDIPYTQPYWLREPGSKGMFKVDDLQKIGMPENGHPLQVQFNLQVEGENITYTRPLIFKRNDPVEGEVYRPFVVVPAVTVSIDGGVHVFADRQLREVTVTVEAGKKNVAGEVRLEIPEDWHATPAHYDYKLLKKGANKSYTFEVQPPSQDSDVEVKAVATHGGLIYDQAMTTINYDHIPAQVLLAPAKSRFVRVALEKRGDKIGYLMGAGDAIPEALEQIGYKVDLINDMDFTPEQLDQYDAIILGVRAFNTVDRLEFDNVKLFDYVKRGGTMVVQYNTSHRLVTKNLSPYEIELSRDRVTVEEAEIKIINKDHPVVNYPNKIGRQDFRGWVQERGLYFPTSWSSEFETVLSSHDPGEKPLNGGLLVAPYGEGHFIYTSYSWFRELPAGVPGAYRLFANLISLGN